MNGFGGRLSRQPRHGHDVPANRHDEFRAGAKPHFAHREDVTRRRSVSIGIGGIRILCLGNAHRQIAEAELLQFLEFVTRLFGGHHFSGMINLKRDGLNLLQRLH